ncbi:MAG: ABC transporter permease [candidate division Zixibacteria bacterium]|nr:ABC transporter permease [candidate division Zixibacteria bacterium]MBU1470827.1 ABC transporter permease [candidate division Zixibacteria bacterium]MBU2625753.1 ABC transporter permease [candidate division Zixibacteria bacterium]
MNTILHLIRKEFLQLKRDKRMLPIIFVAPIFQVIILGYAANLDVNDIPTVICDLDRSHASRELVDKFTHSGFFTATDYVDDIRDIDRDIDRGNASLAVVVPIGFGDDLKAGRQASLQLIADGSDANLTTVGLAYASGIVADYSKRIAVKRAARSGTSGITNAGVDARIRVWYNPELRSKNFMVPGILGLLLMVMTMLLTSLAIVKEKEVGTMEQLVVTPIRPIQLIIGKLTPFAIIGIIDVVLILFVSTFWFDIPVAGSIFLLVFLCTVFLMTTLGLGLFISTVSSTQQQAMMTSVFFVMQPMIFLSGFVFPIENMPKIIQWYTYLLPLRYFFTIVRGIFLKGIGIAELWDEALIMFLFGLAILALSVARFQKKLG